MENNSTMKKALKMKWLILILSILIGNSIFALSGGDIQINTELPSENTSCLLAKELCYKGSYEDNFNYNICNNATSLFFKFKLSGTISSFYRIMNGTGTYKLYGPFSDTDDACQMITQNTAPVETGSIGTGKSFTALVGKYILEIIPEICIGTVQFWGKDGQFICEPPAPCTANLKITGTQCIGNSLTFEILGNYPVTQAVWNFTNEYPITTNNNTLIHSFNTSGNITGSVVVTMTTGENSCSVTLNFEFIIQDCTVPPPPPCEDCITSFSPTSGKYVVSAWVKQANYTPTMSTYNQTHLDISYTGSVQTYSLFAKGDIIDGWQKIDEIIEVPASATALKMKLQVNQGVAYFDDIRFFPFDGSMMSYVYDPVTLRLMAELDERNYATLYEYDEEGKLIRVKKETEKGIMTIQENRDNLKKD